MLASTKMKLVAVGSTVGLMLGALSHAAVDTTITTPIQAFLDYAKENLLNVIGIVLLAVGGLFVLSIGISYAFRWIRKVTR